MAIQDQDVTACMSGLGVRLETFFQGLLAPFDQVRTREGKPFKVFTPFWKTLSGQHAPAVPQRPLPTRLSRGPWSH